MEHLPTLASLATRRGAGQFRPPRAVCAGVASTCRPPVHARGGSLRALASPRARGGPEAARRNWHPPPRQCAAAASRRDLPSV